MRCLIAHTYRRYIAGNNFINWLRFTIDRFCVCRWIGSHIVIDLQYLACHWWITRRWEVIPNYQILRFSYTWIERSILVGDPKEWDLLYKNWLWKCLLCSLGSLWIQVPPDWLQYVLLHHTSPYCLYRSLFRRDEFLLNKRFALLH